LEKTKAITGYGVRLGQQLIDGGLQAYVGITVQSRAGENVVRRMNSMAQVEQLCAVSGEFDYVAWLRSDSPEQLDRLLDQIGELEGVAKTTTPIVHHLEWENRQGAATLGASNFYEQRYRQIARSDGAFRLR
jgi:DNA-binding Lrp family transcriptional regulator